jgi:hypothetical protein
MPTAPDMKFIWDKPNGMTLNHFSRYSSETVSAVRTQMDVSPRI